MSAKGKGRERQERYVRLRHWLLNSQAWNSLSGNARALYVELAQRYNGSNNGRIPYSVREAVRALHVSKATVSRLFRELEDHGFIIRTKRGAFSLKTVKDASEWCLTEYDSDHPPANATKDFMRWQPPEDADVDQPARRRRFKTRVLPRNHLGTVVKPHGYSSETTEREKGRSGCCGETTRREIDPPGGTVEKHLYLPGEGGRASPDCARSAAPLEGVRVLPCPAMREGDMIWITADRDADPNDQPPTIPIVVNRRPWHTPTVTEVPIESLPTELRLMALGLSSGVKPVHI